MRNSLLQLEMRLDRLNWLIVVVRVNFSGLLSSVFSSGSWNSSLHLLLIKRFCKNSGPYHHKLKLNNSVAGTPRDKGSAGLRLVLTWDQFCCLTVSLIFMTRLATYVFHYEDSPLIQVRATVESVQQYVICSDNPIDFATLDISSASRLAPHSSNRGIVCVL